jgi:hypothetical protein
MPERINLGQGLVIVGAAVLFVSLFLDWYEAPFGGSVSAWTAFELLDIVLAGLAIAALVTALPLHGSPAAARPPVAWLPWLGVAAFVLVVITLLNEPPAVHDSGLAVGAWVGFAGAALLAAGGLLSMARISLVITSRTGSASGETETRPLGESEPR